MEFSGFNPICFGLVLTGLLIALSRFLVLHMVKNRHVKTLKSSMAITDWGHYGGVGTSSARGKVQLRKPCSTEFVR